jgi:hypothetical protein
MSKLEQIDPRSANFAPDRVVVSRSEGNSKIIRIRWPGAPSSRKAALRSGDTTVESKVIRFRPRGIASRQEPGSGSSDAMDDSPVPDLRKYESALEGDEEYHQRMVTNFLATVVVIVLMAGGGWVVSTLVTTTREGGDCYRSGVSTCAAVYMPRQRG